MFGFGVSSQEVEDESADGDEVVGGVVFAGSAAVFVEGDIEDPVGGFDAPVLAGMLSKRVASQCSLVM